MYAFGRLMRKLIAENKTSQAEICRATGLTKQSVSWIVNGKTQYPSIQVCKKLADYFGMTLDELYALLEAEERSA